MSRRDDPSDHGPWLLEDEVIVHRHARQRAADKLKRELKARILALDIDNGSTDDLIMLEMRRQMAEAAVSGNLGLVNDLTNEAVDLLTSREYTRKLCT